MIVILMLIIVPFMQLGLSYYASMSMIMLVLVMTKWGLALIRGATQANLLLAVVLLMGLPLMVVPSLDFRDDVLRTMREGVMLLILISALIAFRTEPVTDKSEPPLVVFTGLMLFLLVICTVQTILLPRGIYFGFNESVFAQETGTIASETALLSDPASLRPQATFSEPSYLAFVLLSFSMMLIPRTTASRGATMLMGIIVLVGLMSRSLSFLLAMAAVILLPLMLDHRAKRGIIITGSVIIGTLMLSLTSASILITRITQARSIDTTDYSTLARIGRPLQVIPLFLENYPLGVPLSILLRAMVPFMPDALMEPAEILQNAIFNLIFLYGISGFILFGLVIFLAKDLRTRLYIASCAMFNGAFLAIDKIAMIVMTLAIYEQAKRLANERYDAAHLPPAQQPDLNGRFSYPQRNMRS